MTSDELMKTEANIPCLLNDGKIGLVIQYGEEAGIQVPGEEDIRWVPVDRLISKGNFLVQRLLVNGVDYTEQHLKVFLMPVEKLSNGVAYRKGRG